MGTTSRGYYLIPGRIHGSGTARPGRLRERRWMHLVLVRLIGYEVQ